MKFDPKNYPAVLKFHCPEFPNRWAIVNSAEKEVVFFPTKRMRDWYYDDLLMQCRETWAEIKAIFLEKFPQCKRQFLRIPDIKITYNGETFIATTFKDYWNIELYLMERLEADYGAVYHEYYQQLEAGL